MVNRTYVTHQIKKDEKSKIKGLTPTHLLSFLLYKLHFLPVKTQTTNFIFLLFPFLYLSLSNKMKVAMLRSIQASLRRGTTAASSSSHILRRTFSSESAPDRKVAVLGAAGGIGQPLALLMKLNPLVSQLALYDIAGTPGVAADVSHINTRSEVFFYRVTYNFLFD